MNISKAEWKEICLSLLDHHSLFYKIGEIGKPILTDTIPTACVTFDKSGQFINFLFNTSFWKKSSLYEKLFVICHECLHVILNHGLRFKDSLNPMSANIAMDIIVNHTLVNRFGFVREQISGHEELCWVDTIFKDLKVNDSLISDDETAEFYLNILNKNAKKLNLNNYKLVDSHDFDESSKEFFKNLDANLSDQEKENIRKFYEKHKDQKAGDKTGGQLHFANTQKVTVKRKWESVIQKWAKRLLSHTEKNCDQWARKHRRFSMLDQNLFLPSEMEIEDLDFDNKKIQVYFYLDTSGSCWHLKDRFFAAAESLPKKYFEIRLFCFDTEVTETDLKSKKMYGGGGTKFDILEKNIQKIMKEEKTKYADAVFVITDLYGNLIKSQHPERWYWFADGHDTMIDKLSKEYLQPECKVFKLSDFV